MTGRALADEGDEARLCPMVGGIGWLAAGPAKEVSVEEAVLI